MEYNAVHATRQNMEACAEEFVFGRLSASDRLEHEEHLLICEICRKAVDDVMEFIRLLREATREE